QRFAPQDSSPRNMVRKLMLGCKIHDCFCLFVSELPFFTELADPGRKLQGHRQAQRMVQFSGQSERFLASLYCLLRVAQDPQDPCQMREAIYSEIAIRS